MSDLTKWEQIIYDALVVAAENDQVCPSYLDLWEMMGNQSEYHSSCIMGRLEAMGLIRVKRTPIARIVQIAATGKWTKPGPKYKEGDIQRPRGTHDSSPLIKSLRDIGLSQELANDMTSDFKSLLCLEKRLTRAVELAGRRKIGFILKQEARGTYA